VVVSYKKNGNISTIIYLHKISDNRMTGSAETNLKMFTTLCGREAMQNAVLATTMWSEVKEEDGMRREEELKTRFWGGFDSCRMQS
jgi:hypothetical protein